MKISSFVLSRRSLLLLVVVGSLLLPMSNAFADPVVPYDFATPVFGLATAPDGSLLLADYGAGVVERVKPGGNAVWAWRVAAPISRAQALARVRRGVFRFIAVILY